MGGIVGRLFREFAVTLSVAIAVSLLISLTTTPMMCARLLKRPREEGEHGRLFQASERMFQAVLHRYERALHWVLAHQPVTLLVTLATMAATVYLYTIVPKGFFPQQDTGRLNGSIQADQDTSFQAMQKKLSVFIKTVMDDPAVESATGFLGGSANSGRMFVALKPTGERDVSADQVIARLRGKLTHVPGANLFLTPVQDVRVGGRMGGAQYQYTLQADDAKELFAWAPKILRSFRQVRELTDVNSDQQDKGLQASLVIDREPASRLGVTPQAIDATLYDAFGQRPVSTMYTSLNQYHVILEVAPEFWQNPTALRTVYVKAADGKLIPLSAFTHFETATAPLSVNHSGQFPSVTISFNLPAGVALGQAVDAIKDAETEMRLPATIRGSFAGTAQAFQESLANEPILIMAALLTVYIVLGMLYESLIHPITILSRCPRRAWAPARAAHHPQRPLRDALIGIILLIGIVKKNAILMSRLRDRGGAARSLAPEDAIFKSLPAALPSITLTTMAPSWAGLPLAIGVGTGSSCADRWASRSWAASSSARCSRCSRPRWCTSTSTASACAGASLRGHPIAAMTGRSVARGTREPVKVVAVAIWPPYRVRLCRRPRYVRPSAPSPRIQGGGGARPASGGLEAGGAARRPARAGRGGRSSAIPRLERARSAGRPGQPGRGAGRRTTAWPARWRAGAGRHPRSPQPEVTISHSGNRSAGGTP
jgi:multidrug efflux pump